MTVEIRQVPIGGKLGAFLDVVDYVYRDARAYVRPLNMLVKDQLSLGNPFFEHGEATLFTAHRNGFCVGRCSASIDRGHLERYRDDVGFFGFFDTIDDQEVADALLEAAARWLTDRGIQTMRGPVSLNSNEEMGCLIEGFDTPPMVMTPYHQPYQGGLIEAGGFAKAKDLYAWHYTVGDPPKRAQRAKEDIAKLPEVSIRCVDVAHMERDVRTVMEIFNDAWQDNWGFVPLTESELKQMAKDFKLILVPELALIAHVDGVPAAVSIALPNLNEAIRDLGGKLTPLGALRAIYRLKIQKLKTARLIILGIKKEFRSQRRYAGLSVALYTEMNDRGREIGVESGELSWTLEDNAPVNVAIKMMGGRIYKKFRIYERSLAANTGG